VDYPGGQAAEEEANGEGEGELRAEQQVPGASRRLQGAQVKGQRQAVKLGYRAPAAQAEAQRRRI
jgi:hypothetical protein